MSKKYILTKDRNIEGLRRVKAARSFGDVKKGDLGGLIESEKNLSHEGLACVYGDARVFGDAWVYGKALVYGGACVYGDAYVYGDARVYGKALVYGDAWVYGGNWETPPIQIQGREYFICQPDKGMIKIGCETHDYATWTKDLKKICKKHDRDNDYAYYKSVIDFIITVGEAKP